jgi:hypothetical protein
MRTSTSLTQFIMYETIIGVKRIPGAKDILGNPTYTTSSASIPGCSVQPLTSDELIATGDEVSATWRLFAPGSFDLSVYDYFIAAVGHLEITGDPLLWPDDDDGHVEALAKKWRG